MISCHNSNINYSIEVIKLLIKSGVNLDIRDNNEYTALMISIFIKNKLHSKNIVKMLLDNGAKINLSTYDGWDALKIAAKYSSLDIVKLLLENGANINYRILSNIIKEEEVYKLLIDKIDFENIDEVKNIYCQISKNLKI